MASAQSQAIPFLTQADKRKAYVKRWNAAHREERAAYLRKWYRARSPEQKEKDNVRQREAALRRNFGMTLAEYDAMVAAQGGRCAICGTDKPKGHGNRLHVDHDHRSGKIRGLLCHLCNTRLGWFETRSGEIGKYLGVRYADAAVANG